VNEVVNDGRASLAQWADGRVILDSWFCQTWLTERGLEGREKSGCGIINRLVDTAFAFQFMEGPKLELEIVGDLIMESINHSPDGYQLQVRTLSHDTRMLLKPSEKFKETAWVADRTENLTS